ncbi:hypothetical protein QGM71_07025 [Virgibacillus sp. C22-A2]|uniref:Uncharacterized protein n=1 Tax=Virgibacillus tibetensis TaxID=3042313 RepID=A0ABU6KDT9_9BACI|nr:hypothetical protein [Virgibacillus sp. C22-A2]
MLYILQEIIPAEPLITLFTIVCIVVFFLAFYQLNKNGKIFTGSLFVIGVSIHIVYGNTWLDLFEGITQNLALLSIILLAPLISIPLKQEGIIHTVITKLEELQSNERKTFYGVSSFMMILAPILNMGAIRIVHGFVNELKLTPKILSHAYYVGFTPAIIWSPFFASVGIVLYMTEIAYMSYMLVGILFAFMQVTLGILLFRPKDNGDVLLIGDKKADSKDRRNIYLLVGFVICLVSLLIFLEAITQQPMLLLVCVTCLFIPFLWMIIRNKWSEMREEMTIYKRQVTNHSNMEMGLFLSAGLFGNALIHTPIVSMLRTAIIWSSKATVLLLFLFIICFVTLMAVMGIHQIIVIPLILTILSSPDVNVSLLAAAFMCIFSWMLSASISPLNALNIIISQCVRTNGLRVAFAWNRNYFLGLTGLAFVYVYLLDFIGI